MIIQPSVRGILQGAQDFRRYGIALMVEGVLMVGFGCGFVFAGFGVAGALFGWALASGFSLAFGYFAARRHFGAGRTPLTIDLRRLLQASGGIALTTVAITLGLSDVVLVKHYFSGETAGLYAAVALTGRIVFFVVSFVPAVILPKASSLATRGLSSLPLARRAFATFALLSGCALAVLAVAPRGIVELLTGPNYASAASYVLVYGVAMTFLAATNAATTYAIGLHRFAFAPWLLVAMAAEPLSIVLFHTSLWQVIGVLIAGNTIALGVTLVALLIPSPSDSASGI